MKLTDRADYLQREVLTKMSEGRSLEHDYLTVTTKLVLVEEIGSRLYANATWSALVHAGFIEPIKHDFPIEVYQLTDKGREAIK
mgnify:CR=1 FL=1